MTKLPWYLRLGTTTHVLGRWRAADALACIAEHRIPSIGGVAPQIALLLREDLEAYDLDCVQTLIVGGAASPPALVREAEARFGAAYSIRYSSTESGGCGTGTAFDADDDEALFTVGRPRGGIEVGICDDEAGPAARRRGGRGVAALAHRRWRSTGATPRAPPTRSCGTGCAPATSASSTTRGLLRLAGRLKEMFIRGGYNVYPAEVEAVLADHPAVAEVVVVPRPDDVMGELGVAVVVPADPSQPPDARGPAGLPRAPAGPLQAPRGDPDRGRAPAHPDAEGRPPRPGGPGRLRDPLTPRCHPRVDERARTRTEAPAAVRAAAPWPAWARPMLAASLLVGVAGRGGAPADDDGGRGDRDPATTRRPAADGDADHACAPGPRWRTAPAWCWWSGSPGSPTPTTRWSTAWPTSASAG